MDNERSYEAQRLILPSLDCECDTCYVGHNKMSYSMRKQMEEDAREYSGRLD